MRISKTIKMASLAAVFMASSYMSYSAIDPIPISDYARTSPSGAIPAPAALTQVIVEIWDKYDVTTAVLVFDEKYTIADGNALLSDKYGVFNTLLGAGLVNTAGKHDLSTITYTDDLTVQIKVQIPGEGAAKVVRRIKLNSFFVNNFAIAADYGIKKGAGLDTKSGAYINHPTAAVINTATTIDEATTMLDGYVALLNDGKLDKALSSGYIFVGSAGGVATGVQPKGDVASIGNNGTFTIANDAVTTAKILNLNVTDGKIAGMSASKLTGAMPALDGSALTNLNGSNIATGTVADARLSANVSLLGQTIGAAEIESDAVTTAKILNLNVTDGKIAGMSASKLTGAMPALDGSALTNLNGSNIASGTVADARLSANVSLLGQTIGAAEIESDAVTTAKILNLNVTDGKIAGMSASKLTGAMPALDGSALTNLNGSNIATGTVADARLTANVSLLGQSIGAAEIEADAVTTGKILNLNVTDAKIADLSASKLTGANTLPDGVLSANVSLLGQTIGAAEIESDAVTTAKILNLNVTDGKIAGMSASKLTGAMPALDGAALTNLNGSNIASGTVADARLSANVSLLGQTIGAAEIESDAVTTAKILNLNVTDGKIAGMSASKLTGAMPALDGSALTNLNGSNIATGTVADARLSANVSLLGQTIGAAEIEADAVTTGKILNLNVTDAKIADLSASKLTGANTLPDGVLSANVSLLGQTIGAAEIESDAVTTAKILNLNVTDGKIAGMSASKLTGAMPALDGAALTNLNGSNIASGTVADARLSANVSLLGQTIGAAEIESDAVTTAKILNLNVTDGKIAGMSASKLTGAMPALDGAALTNLNGSNIATGTVADARLSANVSLLGQTIGAAEIEADAVTTGKILNLNVTDAKIADLSASKLTGAMPALDGSALTNLNGSNIATGTINFARLTGVQAANANLTTIAGLGAAADKMLYTDGANSWKDMTTTSFGRSLLALADNNAVMLGSNLAFDGSTAGTFKTTIVAVNPMANNTISLPDRSGTILLSGSNNDGMTSATTFQSSVATGSAFEFSANNALHDSYVVTVTSLNGTAGPDNSSSALKLESFNAVGLSTATINQNGSGIGLSVNAITGDGIVVASAANAISATGNIAVTGAVNINDGTVTAPAARWRGGVDKSTVKAIVGDICIWNVGAGNDGKIYICTVAGTPGTWVALN